MNMDEAIKHAKEKATEKYNEAMLCHANPDDVLNVQENTNNLLNGLYS